jgi:hypothetical protein
VVCLVLAAPSDADAVRLAHPVLSRVGPIISGIGAVLPVVLIALLSPQRLSLSLNMALLLALGLALTGGGAYRLAATARGGPLAAE